MNKKVLVTGASSGIGSAAAIMFAQQDCFVGVHYFRTKEEIIEAGHMPLQLVNYLDKHHALNRTAEELTKRGLTFLAAPKLHKA